MRLIIVNWTLLCQNLAKLENVSQFSAHCNTYNTNYSDICSHSTYKRRQGSGTNGDQNYTVLDTTELFSMDIGVKHEIFYFSVLSV